MDVLQEFREATADQNYGRAYEAIIKIKQELLWRVEKEIERLRPYEKEFIDASLACSWMHDDKTLEIPLGKRLMVEGVAALRKQRDELRKNQFRWIPVGERLPTREHTSVIGEVFCVVRVENFLVAAIRKVPLLSDVTHWAPIPPLPEKSQEEKDEELYEKAMVAADPTDNIERSYHRSGFFAGLKAAREQKP